MLGEPIAKVSVDGEQKVNYNRSVLEPARFIGEYCVDKERKVHIGRSAVRHLPQSRLDKKKVSFDLNKGYDTWIRKDESPNLDTLLDWAVQNDQLAKRLPQTFHEAHFVSWRGLLTKIAVTPYSQRDPWRFIAFKCEDMIFLVEIKTEQAIQRDKSLTEREKLMTYWGFKFEQYLCSESPEQEPNTSEPVDCREEYVGLFRSSLSWKSGFNIQLFYGAEIDAVDSAGRHMELKTQRQAMEGGFWRQKSLKWYMQSFLVGINEIIAGFRDDNGFIERIDTVPLDTLRKNGRWNISKCEQVLGEVLSKVFTMLTKPQAPKAFIVDFPGNNSRVANIHEVASDYPLPLSENYTKHYGI